MTGKYFISAFCIISDGSVNTNHSLLFSDPSYKGEDFFKEVYKHYQINYPKFYKMDALSKLGFLTSELLLTNNSLKDKYLSDEIAIIISNSQSSLESDSKHQKSIEEVESFPSPSVFVYTLPNIMIGEIAIRNSIKGENTFFIFEKYNPDFIVPYVNSLLEENKAAACICGWVDYHAGQYHGFLYTVESQPGVVHVEHNIENTKQLFNTR